MIILNKEQVLQLHASLIEASGDIGEKEILQWIKVPNCNQDLKRM